MSHKIVVLRRGAAVAEPVLRARGLSSASATASLLAAAVAETIVIALLVAAPVVGLLALSGLMLVYTRGLMALRPEEDCACFGKALRAASRARAVVRNSIIAAVATAIAVIYLVGVTPIAAIDGRSVGAALIILAPILAPEALARLLHPEEFNMPDWQK